jgi:hypothetical protein
MDRLGLEPLFDFYFLLEINSLGLAKTLESELRDLV